MAYLSLVILVLISSTFGKPNHKSDGRKKDFYFSPSKVVVDFTVHIGETGEEYNEKIEVDPNKQTELFKVPAHPGVDRSDTLHDFKQKLTMLRFPESKICFLFPLAKGQSPPKKLMRDLTQAKQMVITETRRVDTTWIIDGELTDRSVLSDELADFCAQYPIYRVREARETLKVTGIQTEERANRMRRQTVRGLELNATALCRGGMDLKTAHRKCPEPELENMDYSSCLKYVECDGKRIGKLLLRGRSSMSRRSGCRSVHGFGRIVCYKYVCKRRYLKDDPGSGEGPAEGSGSEEESGEESGDVVE